VRGATGVIVPAAKPLRKPTRTVVTPPPAKSKPVARSAKIAVVVTRGARTRGVAAPVARSPRPAPSAVREVARKAAELPVQRVPVQRATKPVTVGASTRGAAPKVSLAGAKALVRAPAATRLATRLVRVKALDPCARCGPNTSVEQLYRVDEQVAGTATVHLVFFDRHGWYCVHGASCVAVRDVHAELKAQRAGAGRRR